MHAGQSRSPLGAHPANLTQAHLPGSVPARHRVASLQISACVQLKVDLEKEMEHAHQLRARPYRSTPIPAAAARPALRSGTTRLRGVSAAVTLEPWGSGDLPLLERLMGDPRMTEHLVERLGFSWRLEGE